MATEWDSTWSQERVRRRDDEKSSRWPPFAAFCFATASSVALWWLIIRVVTQVV